MKFVANTDAAISVYADVETDFHRTNDEWYLAGDLVNIDFSTVVEPYFLQTVLRGKFLPVDAEAEQWLLDWQSSLADGDAQ
jgi:hypothetical protein